MSRSGWGKFAKIAGLTLLICVGYCLYATLSWHSAALENEATQRTEIHRQNAEDRIKWVCGSSITSPDCIAEARQSQRENEREEQDLAAQKVTAWWTKIMGVAALIGMGLSAIGVWLVKTTFDETRRGNEIALHGASASLVVEGGSYWVSPTMVAFDLTIINSGAAVAHNVRAECKLHLYADRFFRTNEGRPYRAFERATQSWLGTIPSGRRDELKAYFMDYTEQARPIDEVHRIFSDSENLPGLEVELAISWENHFGEKHGIGARFLVVEMNEPRNRSIDDTLRGEIEKVTHFKIKDA